MDPLQDPLETNSNSKTVATKTNNWRTNQTHILDFYFKNTAQIHDLAEIWKEGHDGGIAKTKLSRQIYDNQAFNRKSYSFVCQSLCKHI